jgi:chromosome segregation ATPase
MIKFHYYATSNGECSSYKGVPIQLLSEFRKQFGSKYRIRYRGNRIKFKRLDGRTSTQCYQDCIKKRAEFFSAYAIDNKRKNMEYLNIVINGSEYVIKDNEIKELERDMRLCSEDNERKSLIINDLKEQIERFSAECHDYRNEISDLEERVEELEEIIQSIRYECDRV